MRILSPLAVVALYIGLAAGSASAATSCGGMKLHAGPARLHHITAQGVGCKSARRLARDVTRSGPGCRFHAGRGSCDGFACQVQGIAPRNNTDVWASVTCVAGQRSVSWIYQGLEQY